jgi:hypothetical protein
MENRLIIFISVIGQWAANYSLIERSVGVCRGAARTKERQNFAIHPVDFAHTSKTVIPGRTA